jgi:hypothetical protein
MFSLFFHVVNVYLYSMMQMMMLLLLLLFMLPLLLHPLHPPLPPPLVILLHPHSPTMRPHVLQYGVLNIKQFQSTIYKLQQMNNNQYNKLMFRQLHNQCHECTTHVNKFHFMFDRDVTSFVPAHRFEIRLLIAALSNCNEISTNFEFEFHCDTHPTEYYYVLQLMQHVLYMTVYVYITNKCYIN